MRLIRFVAAFGSVFLLFALDVHAADDGIPVDQTKYLTRKVLPDVTASACPDNPDSLTQLKGNLYRHTTGAGPAIHSGLVLITKEGAVDIGVVLPRCQ
jgi:hypothetical protein